MPSCNTFEDHFSKLGVTPEDLASGGYRGSWIPQYADFLREIGVRITVVCPTIDETRSVVGNLLDLELVRASYLARLWNCLPQLRRGPLRQFASWHSSSVLADRFASFDIVYIQDYATGRYRRLSKILERASLPFVGAHHGGSVSDCSLWVRPALTSERQFTVLTHLEEELLAVKVNSRSPIKRIPNPVSGVWFNEVANFSPRTVCRIVWLGRLEREAKGLDLLLDIIARLIEVGTEFEMSVIGGGSDAEWFSAECRRRGFDDCVRMYGRVDELATLTPLIGSHSILLNTSKIEGFPISVIEAISCGLHVVATELPYVTSELRACPGVFAFSQKSPVDAANLIGSIDLTINNIAGSEWSSRRFSVEAFRANFQELLKLAIR